ncbi:SGNH/GDSL hydrolase family protein [Bacillus sp. MUM 13]|uniref:SGNH/GDSL hydrolase family protein n=1 Tax=Bacillus sp. MUM 13 TaxID=1678001 RepID=UPI0008F5AC79|nr:SGNH/GDSL hydrolase family protein [Bacillus sp. MUM 13]OIK10292.1 GDSL family lipase [Bacillus sp. MUM 13]
MNKVRIMTILSSCIAVLFLVCFGWAMKDYYGKHKNGSLDKPKISASVPTSDKNSMDIVALGDSLTRGTGDDSGKGYVGIVTDKLKKKFKTNVIVHNLGINGQTSVQLAKQVKQEEVKRQLAGTDTVMITIGGNDLFQGGKTLSDLAPKNIKAIQTGYLKNLKSILTDIRSDNKEVTVFVIGLYNPFIGLQDSKLTSAIVRDWNYQASELCAGYSKVVFIPVFDLFQLSINDYLYSDKFHPNQAGYQLIAERIAPMIKWEGNKP